MNRIFDGYCRLLNAVIALLLAMLIFPQLITVPAKWFGG